MSYRRWLGVLAASVCLVQQQAWGWGREGHRLIAHLAGRHLSDKALAAVARMLGPGETLESVAPWADEVRPNRRESSTWHYINIPIDAARGDWRKYCPPEGCVVSVIPELVAKVRDERLPQTERAEALKFLIHFVGDMHQPLHVGDQGDLGGNQVQAVFMDRPTNLHSVWDTALLMSAEDADAGLKTRLERKAGWGERRRWSRGTVESWAWESRDVSRNSIYGKLPAARPVILGAEYRAAAAPVIELQLRKAGIRLAKVLNDAVGR